MAIKNKIQQIEWISSKEELPEESGMYLTTIRYPEYGIAHVTTTMWSAKHMQWNNADSLDPNDEEEDARWKRIVSHWANLPAPAEEEACAII